jgi:hypothetical protein
MEKGQANLVYEWQYEQTYEWHKTYVGECQGGLQEAVSPRGEVELVCSLCGFREWVGEIVTRPSLAQGHLMRLVRVAVQAGHKEENEKCPGRLVRELNCDAMIQLKCTACTFRAEIGTIGH